MPVSVGPQTFGEDNLVFAYDLGDTQGSYIGEPVQNLQTVGQGNVYTSMGTTGTTAELVNFVTPFGNKAWKVTIPASGANGYTTTRAQGPTVQINKDGTPYLHSAYVWMSDEDYALWEQGSTYIYKYSTGSNGMSQWSHRSYFDKKDRNNRIWRMWGAWNSNSQGGIGNQYHTFFKNGTLTRDLVFYIVAPMWGVNKLHPVQFTAGTRSATEGLIDLTGNSTIDLTNVSFDSNAQVTFDGTDDYAFTSATDFGTPTNISFECIIRFNGTLDTNDRKVFHIDKTGSTNAVFQLRKGSTNRNLLYQVHDGSSWTTMTDSDAIYSDTWAHFAVTHQGTSAVMYKNGVQTTTATMGQLDWTDVNNLIIGHRVNAEYWKGDIAMLKIYSRALTASEIKSNYNAIKGRFNI